MEERPDPVQIIARPDEWIAEDRTQALGLWTHLARKAGWQVEPVDEPVDWPAGECGLVDIEGLRYMVRVGLRSRGRAIAAPDEHVGAFAAALVTRGGPVTTFPVLQPTLWAEPVLP